MIGLKKGVENMPLHKAIKRQRAKNITVWIGREYHKKIQRIAFNMGVSITWVLNNILKDYFRKHTEIIKESVIKKENKKNE